MIEPTPVITLQEEQECRLLMADGGNAQVASVVGRINDEYLYWSDVKYRAQALGISPRMLWAVVKYTRARTDVKVPGFANAHFGLTNRMLRQCHELDVSFGGAWPDAKVFPDGKAARELYLASSLMEEAIASSQMEGAVTTREVAKDMLRKRLSPRDKSQRMILNNYNTINFIREHARENLSPEMVFRVHAMLTEGALDIADAAGRFRRDDENIVVGDGITGETVHTPPPARCLPEFVSDLCAFFNDVEPGVFIHPVIRAIIIHYMVGYFHPFADGNGRTARALFYWYMLKSGYWLVQYLSISRVIKGSKRGYEKAYLYAEHDSDDLGYFIQYNLDVLQKSFDGLHDYLARKEKEKGKAGRLLRLGNVSSRQAEILNCYVENPDELLTAADVAVQMGVSQGTAKSDLKDLAGKEYLSEVPLNGKTKAYIRGARFLALIQGVADAL